VGNVELYDLLGALVLRAPFTNTMDLGRVAAGTYMVLLFDRNGRPLAHARLVKD
jgi:hypothetical protein